VITKNKIVSSAISLFNSKGYRATSLSDITKATGFSKGAIYGNFKNKDAVAEAAFDYAVNKVIEEVRAQIKSVQTAPEKLKAITGYYRDYILNPPISGGCPVINTATEADDNHPLLKAKVVRVMSLIKDSIKKILYRGIKEKQIEDNIDVDEFSNMLYASIKGGIIISRAEGDLFSYQQIENYLNKQIDFITC